jgi:MOSC domain-containing protein YiiM
MGMPRFPKLFLGSGRVEFYIRVLKEGEVGVGDMPDLVKGGPERMTVREMMRSWRGQSGHCVSGLSHPDGAIRLKNA